MAPNPKSASEAERKLAEENQEAQSEQAQPRSDTPGEGLDDQARIKAQTGLKAGVPLVDVQAPEGNIVRQGDEITLQGEESGNQTFVTVQEDVWEEFVPRNAKTPSYRLLFHKGQVVPSSVLEQRKQQQPTEDGRNGAGTGEPAAS